MFTWCRGCSARPALLRARLARRSASAAAVAVRASGASRWETRQQAGCGESESEAAARQHN